MFNLILFMELIISTSNIRGTNDSMKRQQISRWMHQSKIDILALQETFVSDSLQSWPEFRNCDNFHSAGTNHARGVSVIVMKRPGLVCTCHDSGPLGCYIILSVQCDKAAFHLTAVYAPVMQKERSTFFSMISKIACRSSSLSYTLWRFQLSHGFCFGSPFWIQSHVLYYYCRRDS